MCLSSLVLGAAIGVVVTAATISSLHSQMRHAQSVVPTLLAGQPGRSGGAWGRGGGGCAPESVGAVAAGGAVGFASGRLRAGRRAGGFFGCGLLMLLGLMLWIHALLCREVWSSYGDRAPANLTVRGLALRNLARHPARGSLSIGLVAAASFLIVATNVFRLDPASETGERRTGSGGFALLAQSDQPIYQNIGSSAGREELGFSAAEFHAACPIAGRFLASPSWR